MTIDQRLQCLIRLGDSLLALETPEVVGILSKAEAENPWFTADNSVKAIEAIRDHYLNKYALEMMANKYHLDDKIARRRVGLVMAGNIPLVGFHDVLCCFLCGHRALIKYSDKDNVLMPWIINRLIHIDKDAEPYFVPVSKLAEYDAVVATGSNTSAMHFEYYFSHVPHIIRRNRNSVAVLSGNESPNELVQLSHDVFSYFGLGCRNVSMLYVPQDYDVKPLMTAFDAYSILIYHNKYKNNFDYNVALFLLNQEKFLHSDWMILKESDQIISRISSVHYKHYNDIPSLMSELKTKEEQIQCIVSHVSLPGLETVGFGQAQCPAINTYADGVDTMQFLLGI